MSVQYLLTVTNAKSLKQHLFIKIFIFSTNYKECFEIPIKKVSCQFSTASEVVRWQYGKAR